MTDPVRSTTAWRAEVSTLCMLYMLIEEKSDYPVRENHTNTLFETMLKAGLVAPGESFWGVTDAGREALKRAVAAQDVLRQMEIFAHDYVAIPLAAEEKDPERCEQVRPDLWDPRFADGNEHAYDMRLAVITWLADTVTKKPVVPQTIVFLQKLGSGKLSIHDHFWANASACFTEVEAIVASAYKWQDAAPGDTELADQRMKAIYAAGQLEQRKRDGSACSKCGIPLVIYEQQAAKRDESLAGCPSCLHVLASPGSTTMSCPKCSAPIYEGDRWCGGCGATIDFSLPAGSVQTSTEETTTTEPLWSSSYGYTSYGWLDPWDPYLDVMALSFLYYDPFLPF